MKLSDWHKQSIYRVSVKALIRNSAGEYAQVLKSRDGHKQH